MPRRTIRPAIKEGLESLEEAIDIGLEIAEVFEPKEEITPDTSSVEVVHEEPREAVEVKKERIPLIEQPRKYPSKKDNRDSPRRLRFTS